MRLLKKQYNQFLFPVVKFLGLGLKKTVKYYLKNRPDPGGVLEKYLGDPFDYSSEDRFIHRFKEIEAGIREIDWTKYEFVHAYGHSME